ncbi:MAG: tetratricopeptide repeat protein [Alkalispirochaeta sp.]
MGHFRSVITVISLVLLITTTVAAQSTSAQSTSAQSGSDQSTSTGVTIPTEGQERFDELQERAVDAQERGEYRDALFYYEQLQEMAPDSGEIAYNRGTLQLAMARYDQALVLFARAEELGFHESRLYYNRGNAYFHRGDLAPAGEEYRMALDIDPDDPASLNNLGIVEFRLGNYEAADEYLQRAGEADRKYGEPFLHLAAMYETMGEEGFIENTEDALDLAEDALGEAIARDPAFVEAWYNRGFLRYGRGKYRAAFSDFLEAHRLQPADPDILHNLGLSALAAAEAIDRTDGADQTDGAIQTDGDVREEARR